ncbi:uncharacterized protein LOC108717790 isoform X2 [Xenopus laevis]|uniref:Uncharacterized protein LOC108717790 isoform X2 n=1 Tax=Xenopus laevis TaxID=8355 RepID=A0A8J0VFZ1_XENLA|nr:uncharacterized protein LOC108717790 isoform X2 [Xenopus laevis]
MSQSEDAASPGFCERIRRLFSRMSREEQVSTTTSDNTEPDINEVHTSQDTVAITEPKTDSSLEDERMARLQILGIKSDFMIDKIKTLRQEIQALLEEIDWFEIDLQKRRVKLFRGYLDRRNSDRDDGSEIE